MKKLFFIAAIAIAALVSCTKNDVAPSASDQQEITFANPVSHVVTKVDLVPTTYPTTSSFSVFADHHKSAYNTAGVTYTPYMRGSEGVDVTYKTDELTINNNKFNQYWAPTTTYYWPKDGYLTFAAYSPAGVKNVATIKYGITHGVEIENYVVNTDPTKQIDLMLSNREVDETSDKMEINKPAPYDGVQLTFRHVLSAIDFIVKTAKDYKTKDQYTITLKSITIKNAFTTGTLKQFANAATYNIDLTAIWSAQTAEGSYEVLSDTEITSAETAITPEPNIADLVLLPQDLVHTVTVDGVSTEKKVTAEVVYTVAHPDMGKDDKGKDVSVPYTASLDLSGFTDEKWEAGKRYTYKISIGMDEVVFAPEVTKWDEGDPIGL